MAEDTSIQIRDLTVSFSDLDVLNGISMEIKRRAVNAIIGPSGAGKSTLLRCLNRMVDLAPGARVTGQVFFRGRDVLASGVDVVKLRQQVGMVFQKPNPFPKTIYENVAYGPRIRGENSTETLDEVVETALRGAALYEEVSGRLNTSAMDLSGGQQQRLCIARCLAVKPEVLLMDEPCSALDPAATARIENLIGALAEELTVVIVTHNMQQAARISDYTSFILDGELVEVGPTEKIFTNADDPRTEDYVRGKFG